MGSPECSACEWCGEVERWDYMVGVGDDYTQYCDGCVENVAFKCEECGEFHYHENMKICPENPNRRICECCFEDHLDDCETCGYKTCTICNEDFLLGEYSMCKDKVICLECNKEHIKECIECANKYILSLKEKLMKAKKELRDKDKLIEGVSKSIKKISEKLDNN